MLSEDGDREPMDIEFFEHQISGRVVERLDKIYEENDDCIHGFAEDMYGEEFHEAEGRLNAAETVGDEAKNQISDLRTVIYDMVDDRGIQHHCIAYVGARAFNNGNG